MLPTAPNLQQAAVKSPAGQTPKQILLSTENILKEFPEVFSGLGCLKNYQFDIHIDHTVAPIAQSYRRVPFHIRKQVEEELDRLQKAGIIEDATGPTPWISPIVVAPKKDPSQVRICVEVQTQRYNANDIQHLQLKKLYMISTGLRYFHVST